MFKNLKPCPFCGSDIEVSELICDRVGIIRMSINCRCGASVSFYSDDRMSDWQGHEYQMGLTALEKWNRRAGEEEQDEHGHNDQTDP